MVVRKAFMVGKFPIGNMIGGNNACDVAVRRLTFAME